MWYTKNVVFWLNPRLQDTYFQHLKSTRKTGINSFAKGTIRISLGKDNTEEDVEAIVIALKKILLWGFDETQDQSQTPRWKRISTFQTNLTLINYHPHFSFIPWWCRKEGSALWQELRRQFKPPAWHQCTDLTDLPEEKRGTVAFLFCYALKISETFISKTALRLIKTPRLMQFNKYSAVLPLEG